LACRICPLFLDPIEVLERAPAALDRPPRAACEHRVHFMGIQVDRSGAAHAYRDPAVERLGELRLNRHQVAAF
jgi:hypothetical protein